MHFHLDARISLLKELGDSLSGKESGPGVPNDLSFSLRFGDSHVLRQAQAMRKKHREKKSQSDKPHPFMSLCLPHRFLLGYWSDGIME
jgi:hypothetical protein